MAEKGTTRRGAIGGLAIAALGIAGCPRPRARQPVVPIRVPATPKALESPTLDLDASKMTHTFRTGAADYLEIGGQLYAALPVPEGHEFRSGGRPVVTANHYLVPYGQSTEGPDYFEATGSVAALANVRFLKPKPAAAPAKPGQEMAQDADDNAAVGLVTGRGKAPKSSQILVYSKPFQVLTAQGGKVLERPAAVEEIETNRISIGGQLYHVFDTRDIVEGVREEALPVVYVPVKGSHFVGPERVREPGPNGDITGTLNYYLRGPQFRPINIGKPVEKPRPKPPVPPQKPKATTAKTVSMLTR